MPFPGRSAARSTCEAVRCRAGAVANSGAWYGPGSAEQREERCTASGTQALALVADCRTVMRAGAGTDCAHFSFDPYINDGSPTGHVQLEHPG
jgi:hypothetical protein